MSANLTATDSRLQEHLKAWNACGFVIMPDILSPDECRALKAEALQILRDHAKPGATVVLGCSAVSENFARLAERPQIMAMLKLLLPEGIEFLSDKLVYKKPGKDFATPWHIDEWYWKNTRPKISVWIPFDDASAESGTLTVVPGSHRRQWVRKQSEGINSEFVFAIDHDIPGKDIFFCDIKAGTAIIFSDLLLHGSTPSRGQNERYAIISTYHAPGHEHFDDQFPARRVLFPKSTE
jgi:ectoine hydroxylase-related dioxygenase (phytanoyl-CoA dioxygenase family)